MYTVVQSPNREFQVSSSIPSSKSSKDRYSKIILYIQEFLVFSIIGLKNTYTIMFKLSKFIANVFILSYHSIKFIKIRCFGPLVHKEGMLSEYG